MSILYWGGGSGLFGARLRLHSDGDEGFGGIHVESSKEGFRVALATKNTELHLVILAPPSSEALASFRSLAPLLAGIPVVVLLPTNDSETLALAHRFRPRFVSSSDGVWEEAATVAAHMLNKMKTRERSSRGGTC